MAERGKHAVLFARDLLVRAIADRADRFDQATWPSPILWIS